MVDPQKKEFIKLRLSRRLKELNLHCYDEYLRILKVERDGAELRHLVEVFTTHTTSFFREGRQYDWLEREGLEMLASTRTTSQPLTVWSAASSTGAELWSAGMVLMDAAQRGTAPGNFALIGSDISRRILNTAQRATYSEAEIAGVSEERRSRYLMKSKRIFGAGRQHFYRIIPQLRERAMFEPANLTQLQSARSFTVDFAFLRNVLIYFEEDMQEQVVSGVISRVRPGGFLLTGHSEALPPRPDLRALAPSIYQKV